MLSVPLTKYIHENISVIVTYAFSAGNLEEIREKFIGRWRYLEKFIFEIPEEKANRAIIEMALLIRMLNEQEQSKEKEDANSDNDIERYINEIDMGILFISNDKKEKLNLREFSNKIIHSGKLEWDFEEKDNPKLVSFSRNGYGWHKAEISIVKLMGYCGMIMS